MKKYIYLFTVIAVAISAVIILKLGKSKDVGEVSPKDQRPAQVSARADSGQADSRTSGKSRGNPDREHAPVATLIPVKTDSMPRVRAEKYPRIRGKKFTLPSGERVELKMEDDTWSIEVVPDPSGTLLLVNQASGRSFSIYNLDGELVHNLPLVADALPELNPRTQFQWHWGHGEKLVATLGIIDEVLQNQYPESDTVAYDVRLYSYDPGTRRLEELKVPYMSSGDGLLRLDGISEEGFLLISQVPQGEDYWDTGKGKLLGFYRIPE